MLINYIVPARHFFVGKDQEHEIVHVANCQLETNELITFLGPNSEEYDLVAKDWGFYATPSLNSRLAKFGFSTALVENAHGEQFIHIVYKHMMETYRIYCSKEKITVTSWLCKIET